MKKELFGIGMGVSTGFPINIIIFNGNLISAFFLGMGFTFMWLQIYEFVIKPRLKNPVGVK